MTTTDGVTVTFELKMKPEAVEMFLQAVPVMLKDTAAFAGFRDIRIVQHKDDPTRLMFLERWDSEDAYDKYMAWRTSRGDMDGLAHMVVSTETNIWPRLVVAA